MIESDIAVGAGLRITCAKDEFVQCLKRPAIKAAPAPQRGAGNRPSLFELRLFTGFRGQLT
jgi:hypothetical protein